MNWRVKIKNLEHANRTQKTQKSSIDQKQLVFNDYVSASAANTDKAANVPLCREYQVDDIDSVYDEYLQNTPEACIEGINHNDPKIRLMATLTEVCRGLLIEPSQVYKALSTDDMQDWQDGDLSSEMLKVFAQSLVHQQQMARGEKPEHYTEQATCQQCGPVWLWMSWEVLGCPWCLHRVAGKTLPRPTNVI